LGFFVLPYLSLFEYSSVISKKAGDGYTFFNLVFYLLIFANMGKAIFGNIAYTSQTWSLATEEQFYLIWPLLIEFFNKKLLPVMCLIVFLYFGVSFFLIHLPSANYFPYQRYISRFWWDFNINCMAIGGIFAVLIHRKHKLLNFIFNKVVFISTTIITITLLLSGVNFGIVHYDIYATLFAIIISNLAFNQNYSTILENKLTGYLGTISYGMYMYHCIVLVAVIKLGIYFKMVWIIYPLTFLITIGVSHLSYKYFESYFLRLKTKFESK
jgi:peptidoglycan/LPS O-acetylase OafA/YrhL